MRKATKVTKIQESLNSNTDRYYCFLKVIVNIMKGTPLSCYVPGSHGSAPFLLLTLQHLNCSLHSEPQAFVAFPSDVFRMSSDCCCHLSGCFKTKFFDEKIHL